MVITQTDEGVMLRVLIMVYILIRWDLEVGRFWLSFVMSNARCLGGVCDAVIRVRVRVRWSGEMADRVMLVG